MLKKQEIKSRSIRFSWSDIKLFLKCPKCFYFLKKFNIKTISEFNEECCSLANFTDQLLKKEFDQYRKHKKQHPLMKFYNLKNCYPFVSEQIQEWRISWNFEKKTFGGIQWLNYKKNLLIHGCIDDIWINDKQELIIVDYKSSKNGSVYLEYIKQLELYSWLFIMNNYKVSETGYLLIYKPINKEQFDWSIQFNPQLLYVSLDYSWIESTIDLMLLTLKSSTIPYSGYTDLTKNKTCLTCENFDKRYSVKEFNKFI